MTEELIHCKRMVVERITEWILLKWEHGIQMENERRIMSGISMKRERRGQI